MEINELQQQLFSYLKDNLPPHLSLVDELSGLLDLSADSVYRRIRGEKPISFSELKKICGHYHLSIDQMLQLQNDSVLFNAPGLTNPTDEVINYLKGILRQFMYFNSFKRAEIHYLCKDIPLWYIYLFPAMAAFKTFFFSKSINNHPELSNKKFSLEEYHFKDCFDVGQQILLEHSKLHSVELWNLESINSAINQIAYYKDAGNFKSINDFEAVINSFHQMLGHLELQAEKGVKFMPGATDVTHKGPIQFYVNDLILGSNTVLVSLDGKRISMITYTVYNYLVTRDTRFTGSIADFFTTLLSRSTVISKTGEKDRIRFFNTLRERVNSLKK